MIVILYLIKFGLQDNDTFKPTVVEAVYPTDSIKPFSFLDYVTAINSNKTCVEKSAFVENMDFRRDLVNIDYSITGINALDWPVPFVKCNAAKCEALGQDAGEKHCEINVLALAPTDPDDISRRDDFKNYIQSTYPMIANHSRYDIVKTFDSKADMDDYIRHSSYGVVDADKNLIMPKIAIAVLIGGSGTDYEYSIRTNSTGWNSGELFGRPVMYTQPSTEAEFNAFAKKAETACPLEDGAVSIGLGDSNCNRQYMYNGALTIQRLVGDFIQSDTNSGYNVAENGVSFADFPSKEYVQDGFYAVVASFVPLLLVLGLLFPFATMIRGMVREKEMRQKELMKMMSVSEFALEVSWFLSLYGFSFFSGILLTAMSTLFYEQASPLALFVFWQFAFISIVVFSMFISAFFSKTPRATLVGVIVFFAGYFLTLTANVETGSRGLISLVSLHPITALSYGVQIIGSLEDAGVGVVPSTLTFSEFPSGYNFAQTLFSFISSTVWFSIFTWYVNRVFPGPYGQALKWNFMFTRSYWCASRINPTENLEEWTPKETDKDVKLEPPTLALQQQEAEGTGVHIRGLTKTYGENTVVSELDLSMYEGQVFALLGHNGAGKTTTINMLTGMTSPTSGYAIINGKSINSQMPEIRENLGICLQHDCLFDELTVTEHLRFFARLKGLYNTLSYEDAEESIANSIRDVALFEKRNTFSKDLSGGMKRKLSLAIAFCGDSSVVFLDEPTSGMDPHSRRFTWNVIRQNRQDRCIILTTHFMDEADLLGDRIGILAEGQLRCCGSSLFLKKEFGVGYQISIEKKSESASVDATVTDIIVGAVPEATVLSNVSSELSFQLPLDSSSQFISMFAELDKIVAKEQISMYGVSITTLEEVFIMVGRGETGDRDLKASFSKSAKVDEKVFQNEDPDSNASYASAEDMNNQQLFARHVQALLQKRAMNFKRDKRAWICSTILPCIFALLGFVNAAFFSQFKSLPPLELKLSNYNPTLQDTSQSNPTPFNKGGSFPCQPGQCISTYDEYFGRYCGAAVSSNETCYGIDVSDIGEALEGKVDVIDQDVSTVEKASMALPENYDDIIEASQYGAFYFTHSENSYLNNDQSSLFSNVASLVCAQKGIDGFDCSRFLGLGLMISTNFTAPHAAIMYQALADEAIVRAGTGINYNIKATIDPLPYTDVEEGIRKSADAFSIWFYLVLSFPFITGTFATFIVQERMSKAKHLQTVAGVTPSAYWLSSYLWDILNYQFPLWIIVIMMYAFDIEAFITSERSVNSGTILLLFFFGPAAAGFTYILTFLFKSPSSANMFVIVSNFFIGFVGALVSLILRVIYYTTIATGGESNLKDIAVLIEWILRFIPSFCVAKGLLCSSNILIFVGANPEEDIDVFSPDVLRYELIFLVWQSVVYISLAIFIDTLLSNQKISNWFNKKKTQGEGGIIYSEIDDDVANEAERILAGEANNDIIVLSELKKQYSNGKVAVDGLSFGIPRGQCFGLLGINGAGKTTTMAMLTAEFPPTSGDATLSGYSITSQPEETRRRIGYCPQFDAHFVNLTGREHVKLYAGIKGLPKEYVEEATKSKLAEVGLSEFDSDRLSSTYSGGMKRKLSVACATIANPKIVFLDEPSTGMDPASRRDLWTVISDMVSGTTKTSVILTTHSMEECEALCPRIGIMAAGQLKCIGSAQHLKTKFGQGYQMELKVEEAAAGGSDFDEVVGKLLQSAPRSSDIDVENGAGEDVTFNLEQAKAGAQAVTGDTFLSDKIHKDDSNGYFVFKSAESNVGVSVLELAAFCATELRLRDLQSFFARMYPNIILRERQDTRMRFEVPATDSKISSLFEVVEENKSALHISEYGISQTTLEQVFNMHAAEAEKLKEGTDDG